MSLPGRPSAGPLLADCEGALREIVIQYIAEAEFALPVYRQFLAQLPAGDGGAAKLLLPRGEDGADLWPARAGDQRVGWDLARALGGRVEAEKSGLHFDGGDFVADDQTVFVATNVIRRNLQRTVESIEALHRELERALRKKVVLLENSPGHHAGMFMMVAGNRTVLVGDPSLAKKASYPELPGGADFSETMQQRFDSVAKQVAAAGYSVLRVPIVPAADGRTYLTWLNVMIDQRDGRRIVSMPVYEGCEVLNERARRIWTDAGHEVRDIDCTGIFREFGCLRCLVNVVSR